jgi:hypothetical protein
VADSAVAAAAVDADNAREQTSMKMNSKSPKCNLLVAQFCMAASVLWFVGVSPAQQAAPADSAQPPKSASSSRPSQPKAGVRTFTSPQEAADVLVKAAEEYDEKTLAQIFGPEGDDVVFTGELVQDRKHAANFAKAAREKMSVSVDPNAGNRAFVLVGNENWPFPVPLVKSNQKWFFDSRAGREELLYRRIGSNELDAIQICHGYVEAQESYALQPGDEYKVNQYAQRIISSPGKQDGLAWQNADGTWGGPIGEKIAKAIEQGYTLDLEPYHGYLFKILKGQGPAAPLGQMDYMVQGYMIGGFALVASPAEYGVTGVQTFIVSQDGVVYQKDLGEGTLGAFKTMELFNPDDTWTPVPTEDDSAADEQAAASE